MTNPNVFQLPPEESLEEAVFTSLGAASTCWENLSGAGVFESTRAKAIGEALMNKIREELGLARASVRAQLEDLSIRYGEQQAELQAVKMDNQMLAAQLSHFYGRMGNTDTGENPLVAGETFDEHTWVVRDETDEEAKNAE